jgi:hypothetical protein
MTSDEKCAFYREMFELQASYLHHRLRRESWWGMDYAFGNFSQIKAISKFAPGVRMDLDEIAWRKVLATCWDAFWSNKEDREKFVAVLWSVWGERWLAAYPPFERSVLDNKFFGCFRYDHSAEGPVHLHFSNNDEPHSPFADMSKRKNDLREIVRELESNGIRPTTVHFDSWMNNLKPIAELFPASFAKSLVASEEFPKGYGWWGQFITREGHIHARRAELLKREGRFEFLRLNGHCLWSDFKASIEK